MQRDDDGPRMTKLTPYYEAPEGSDDHEDLGRPFRITAKLQNNRLIKARLALGHATCSAAAKALELDYQTLTRYESLSISPWNSREGDWKASARKVADALGYHPSELWPDVMQGIEARALSLEVGSRAVLPPPDASASVPRLREAVDSALSALTPRERKVLEERFGIGVAREKTLDEMRGDLGVKTGEAVRLVEAKALRKLRQPSTARALLPFIDDEGATEKIGHEKPIVRYAYADLTCKACGRVTEKPNAHAPRLGGDGRWSCAVTVRADALAETKK